ncbi:MAG: hypothetical protein AAF960_05845 [Bacteroidota bacterium]
MFGIYASPAILLGSGLLVGILFLVHIFNKKQNPIPPKSSPNLAYLLDILVFCMGIYCCYQTIASFVDANPCTDYYSNTGSDVLPCIGISIERFLQGEFPYKMINDHEWDFQHNLFPTYLPLLWMPFIIPHFLSIDFRLFAFFIFVTSLFCFYYKTIFYEKNWLWRALQIAAPFSVIYFYSQFVQSLKFVVEPLVIAYYLLLALGIMRRKNWLLLATALVLCLLSRYAIVLFVPLIFWVIGIEESRLKVVKIATFTGIGILTIYILPFLTKDPTIFHKSLTYYTVNTGPIWERHAHLEQTSKPSIFTEGIGTLIYTYQYGKGTVIDRYELNRDLHYLALISVVLALGFIYWRYQQFFDGRLFLLGGMKIYLVLFYNLISYPFPYLFLTPIILSLPLIYLISSDSIL